MINISRNNYYNNQNDFERHNSILIIGKGEDEYKNKSIERIYNLDQAIKYYGEESALTTAFNESYSVGARNIYVCNCFKFTDYLDIVNNSTLDEFYYVTPLFNFSETFSVENNNTMYLCEFYSNILSESITQLILTDKHASLYEDINHYIRETNNLIDNFKMKTTTRLLNGSNLCFVTNNLIKFNYANVALASLLTIVDLSTYPQKDLGKVVFDLNDLDFFNNEVTYFAYDDLSKTTIENFLNFNDKLGPEKYVQCNLVKQDILRALDFSNFGGKLLAPNITLNIQTQANEILNSKVGKTIQSYKITKFNYLKNVDNTITIKIGVSILPYNSIEELNINLEV